MDKILKSSILSYVNQITQINVFSLKKNKKELGHK